jgi:uncharacterized protein (DUF1501 family)
VSQLNRRSFLKAGAAAGLATLPGLARALPRKTTAERCVLISLVGGPSQLDTWDPKPTAPSDYRSPFAPIPTRIPGVHFTDLFPKLAAMADQLAVIRTVTHPHAPVHEFGLQLLNTGRLFRDGPAAPHVGTTLVKKYDFAQLSSDVTVDCGIPIPVGLESRRVTPGGFADQCKAVVDSLERGVKFLAVPMYRTVFDAVTWDCHADGGALASDLGDYRDTVAPLFDSAFTGLLKDLSDRGLLDSTLVIACGEFGRTPKRNAMGGRDHWTGCWTALVAGGGVQGGRVIGESDAVAGEPKDRPVQLADLTVTVGYAFGKDIPGCTGKPVTELF